MKIDKSIISQNQEEKNYILEFCMGLAEVLGLKIVVEGVETEQQFNALRTTNCDIIQGYFYSKPLSMRDYEVFLVEHC